MQGNANGVTDMTKQDALKKWAEVYGKALNASNFAGTCINTAIAYGVSDMVNQTKGMTEDAAAFMISDDADWMMEKMA